MEKAPSAAMERVLKDVGLVKKVILLSESKAVLLDCGEEVESSRRTYKVGVALSVLARLTMVNAILQR